MSITYPSNLALKITASIVALVGLVSIASLVNTSQPDENGISVATENEVFTIPVHTSMTDKQYANLQTTLEQGLQHPITVTVEGDLYTRVIQPSTLARMISIDDVFGQPEIVIDHTGLRKYFGVDLLVAQTSALSLEPQSEFDIRLVNFPHLSSLLTTALKRGSDSVSIASESIQNAFDAEESVFDTTDEEPHTIASFTTYYECCKDRTTNIKQAASLITNTTLEPGAVFSMNQTLGERTDTKGFKKAPMILNGELVGTVGGGISQVATTLFGMAFFGGLDITSSTPHSKYFERYPMGIEATVSWPVPDLMIKNTYDSPVVIIVETTDTSITARLVGLNDGRTIEGRQIDGELVVDTVSEGGDDARIATWSVGEPYNNTTRSFDFVADTNMQPGETSFSSRGEEGFSVDYTQTITENGKEATMGRTVVYDPQPYRVSVYPCDIPASRLTHFRTLDHTNTVRVYPIYDDYKTYITAVCSSGQDFPVVNDTLESTYEE